MTAPYATLEVPVTGGVLHVGRWGTGPATVLAAHGITATHRSMTALASRLGEGICLLAPDLRGRGGSNSIGPPFSMEAHADDFVAVLDHVGAPRALVLGHSMGAFAAVVAAHRHPDRVAGLVLVDGGLPLELGSLAEQPIGELLAAVIGPALERLHLTFPSAEAYLDYWRAHPALSDDWNDYMRDAFAYDLEGQAPALGSGVREAAVMADAESQLVGVRALRALEGLTQPAVLVRAPTGMLGAHPPLYTDAWTAHWQRRVPGLRSLVVPDVNHYTILFTERGAAAVARVVREELPAQAVGPRPVDSDDR